LEPQEARHELTRAARAGVMLVVAGGMAGILNLLFNVLVARRGGAASYGAIGSLLTVVTVVGIVATGFQYGIARQAAVSSRAAREMVGPALRSVLPWALLALLLALLSWPLAGFLRLPSVAPVLLIAGVAVVSVFGAAVSGLLVGFRRFRVIAGLGVGAALLRLGLGFLVGRGPAAVTITLVISLVGLVASFLAGILLLTVHGKAPGKRSDGPAPRPSQGNTRTAGMLGALIAGALWTVWGLPVLFARHLLSPAAAGDYAATQLLAGALIWGTAPIVTAFFPTIARFRTRSAVLFGELATLAIALAGAAVLTTVGPIVFQRIYGSSFGASRPLLAVLSLSATATACATFAAWSAMAGRVHVGRVLMALVASLAAETIWDLLGAHVATALAIGPLVSLAIGGIVFVVAAKRDPAPLTSSAGHMAEAPSVSRAALRGER
jgi:O-antigen/teichoic acid export membrane protein